MHAKVESTRSSYYHEQLKALPQKETYTREELGGAVWQVWMNRMSLPQQKSYTVEELKAAMPRPFLATEENECDRRLFDSVIARTCGYRVSEGTGLVVTGVVAMLIGAFILGNGFRLRKSTE